MTRFEVSPELLMWSMERARRGVDDLSVSFPKLPDWIAGDVSPTLRQLDKFAKAVHVPIGYLFLNKPPHEELPIPDFRTLDGQEIDRPSPDLLDTIYACQERQSWYKEFAQIYHQDACSFIGSIDRRISPTLAADQIREAIGFDIGARQECSTWEDALHMFVAQTDRAGILVMVSGIVHSNTRRKLDPSEFRGFALSDRLAPLIFINGADTKSAQMFTLAHELAHLWLDETGLSNISITPHRGYNPVEVWCNAVAAELLVPMTSLQPVLDDGEDTDIAVPRLSRLFKVSTLVILRRLLDAKWFSRSEFERVWGAELARLREIAARRSRGGNFYRSTVSRAGKRFTRALIASTLEGQTLYRDAYRMLGVRKSESFKGLGREVGMML